MPKAFVLLIGALVATGGTLAACVPADPGPGDAGLLDASSADAAVDPWLATRTLIEERMASRRFPGMAVAVLKGTAIVWSAGFGDADIEANLPVTADTPFQLASVSKTVIGAAILRASEQGTLSLDSEVNTVLPFAVDNPRVEGEVIRLRHLATHTAGINDNWDVIGPLYVTGDSAIALGTFLRGYLVAGGDYYDDTLNFTSMTSGAAWLYSNIGATLAAYVVEVAVSAPFDHYCNEQIFGPLQMTRTGWHLADFADTSIIAQPYEDLGTSYRSYGLYGYPDYPDGALRTSATDFIRFIGAIVNGGTFDGATILSAESVAVLTASLVPELHDGQGVFWMTVDIGSRTLQGIEGSEMGVYTAVGFDPDSRVGAVVLTNTDWTRARSIAVAEILTSIFDTAEAL